MKSQTTGLLLACATAVAFTIQSFAQGTMAPLYLLTTGDGTITPFQNEQMLLAGQVYSMTAIPNSGSMFSSWQPVNVEIDIAQIPGQPATTNVTFVLVAEYLQTPTLRFIMQAETAVGSGFGVHIYDRGWQANFLPVPEPSAVAIIACGVLVLALPARRS